MSFVTVSACLTDGDSAAAAHDRTSRCRLQTPVRRLFTFEEADNIANLRLLIAGFVLLISPVPPSCLYDTGS